MSNSEKLADVALDLIYSGLMDTPARYEVNQAALEDTYAYMERYEDRKIKLIEKEDKNGFKAFRDRSGYTTQGALAEVLDVGTANVSKWEAGNGYPSYGVLKRLLEMGATVEELFGIEYGRVAAEPKWDFSEDFVRNVEKALKVIAGRI
jgi:DNA-binding transcriptional regulator YiaG